MLTKKSELILSVTLSLIFSLLQAIEESKPVVPTVTEKNKEADRAFLYWKLNVPHSHLSPGLRTLLTAKGVDYLVQESQLPFNESISQEHLDKKISTLTDQFLKKFNPSRKIKVTRQEVEVLVKEVIAPEYVFLDTTKKSTESDRSYNEFLDTLRVRKTRVGTTLEEWALRFLTSESILVALPIIERLEMQGKSFNEMTPNQKKRALQPVIDVVALRFINNLRPVKEKFRFNLPLRADVAIKDKIRLFLHKKFAES